MNILKNLLTVTGKCVLPNGLITLATVVIDTITGLILEVKEAATQCDIAVPDCLVIPGVVETHVHLRESVDGEGNRKETFQTGGEALLNGGVVHACEMGNNKMIPSDRDSYEAKDVLTQSSPIPITLYATVVKKSRPFRYRSRRVPFKVFMGPSIGDSNFETNEECEDTVKDFTGENMSSHCEDPHILRANKDKQTHEERRPMEAEITSIAFAIYCAQRYGIKQWKVCHVSTKDGKRLIVAARRAGVPIICEGTHHHAWFNTLMLTDANRKMLQMNPPIRSPRDQEAILEGLQNGDIDILAGDHAPHEWERDKMSPNGMSGVTQADTYGAFLTWLIKHRGFTPQRIALICSTNPGLFVNPFLPAEFGKGYGKIEQGFMGSLTILDLNNPVTVTKSKLRTKCKWSPFEGITFPGSVRYTIVRGKVYEPIMR